MFVTADASRPQKAHPAFNHSLKRSFLFNFHTLEVVSRYRDPQLQVCENYSFA